MRILALVLLAVAVPACSQPASDGAGGADCLDCSVIFLLVDTLAADHMSLYGYPRETTPKLAVRAGEFQVFEEAISQSTYTTASMASIHTALYPSRHGVGSHNTAFRFLAAERVTLAEILADAGYATAGFNANPLISEKRGFHQGFDTYDSECLDVKRHGVLPNCVSEKGKAWLREHADSGAEPFLLYLHFMDVHSPYVPVPPFRNHFYPGSRDLYRKRLPPRFQVSLDEGRIPYCFEGLDTRHRDINYYASSYDDGVRYIDSVLDDLLAFVDDLELGEVIVVVTSDHGEEFLQRGRICHMGPPSEAQIHVPLLIRHPRIPGGRLAGNVETIDLVPTLLESLGVEADEAFDGTSLLPALRGEPGAERTVYSEVPRVHGGAQEQEWRIDSRAIKRGSVKLIEFPGSGKLQLLEDSGGEYHYSGSDAAEVQAALQAELVARVARLGTPRASDAPLVPEEIVDPDTAEALRVLGYAE